MRIALAQLNTTVGDLVGNRGLVENAVLKAEKAGADLVVAPEMVLTGYPPMDLLERPDFIRDQLRELEALLPLSRRVAIALGAVLPCKPRGGKKLENTAVVLQEGRQVAVQAKSLLPTYDVFDEKRYFAPALGGEPIHFERGSHIFGLSICEDAWTDQVPYDVDPIGDLAASGADVVLNLSASPWHRGKARQRREILASLAKRHGVQIVFANQIGGNDELVFDGGSFVTDRSGRIRASLPLFEPAVQVVDFEQPNLSLEPDAVEEPEQTAQLEAALVLGIQDYFRKQDLPPGAVIGLSGGIDSSVTAHLAVAALGRERVLGISMPGPYSSEHSVDDALKLAENLGIEVRTVPIGAIYESYLEVFRQLFGKREDFGITQQNIQSRIRGAVLMAASNSENRLVLATGNKSELSIGYCTLYGDTVGGLAVLGDVYKHEVYALADHANRKDQLIPENSIRKPPSAELAPNQLDLDDLPPYETLDAVLAGAIEGNQMPLPPDATPEIVRDILRRLDDNEYKRRQSPLILRVSPKAFGTGRRQPIVHRRKSSH